MPANFHTRQPALSAILRVLLIFAAWTGPVPYLHCHCSLRTATGEYAARLSEHLRTQHTRTAMYSDEGIGWHFHYCNCNLPGDELGQNGGQRILPGPNCRASIDHAAADQDFARLFAPALDLPDGSATLDDSPAVVPTSFYLNYAASLPLPLRFGVVRC